MTSSIVEFATRTAVRCLPLLAQYELITGKKLARWSVIFLFAQLGLSGQQSKPKQTPRPPFTSAQSAPATLHGSFASLRMTGSHLAPLRFDSNAPVRCDTPVEIRKALPMRTSKPPSQARRKFGLSRVSDSHHCLASRSTGHISSPEILRDQHHSET